MAGAFRVELRGAKPVNGHTGEAPVTEVTTVEAESWIEARECMHRRYGIDAFDPAMIVTRETEEAVPPEPVTTAQALETPRPKRRR